MSILWALLIIAAIKMVCLNFRNPVELFVEMGLELSVLLRLAWLIGTGLILLATLPFHFLSSYSKFVMSFSNRGKTMPSSSTRFTVPQRYFLHFYILAVLWTTILLLATWFYAFRMAPVTIAPLFHSLVDRFLTGGSDTFPFEKSLPTPLEHRFKVWQSAFLLLLMEAHVYRRLFETIHIFRYSPTARMHIFGYLTGLFFYIAAPLSLCCNVLPEVYAFVRYRILEFIVKGKDRMLLTEFDWWECASPLLKLGWCQYIGAAIFSWGCIHQHLCHKILGSLREELEQLNEYVIPFGDWFEIVSSPHYLAEIVLWRTCGRQRIFGLDNLATFRIRGDESSIRSCRNTQVVPSEIRQLPKKPDGHHPIPHIVCVKTAQSHMKAFL